jgi:nucleoid-associated protein YgaU
MTLELSCPVCAYTEITGSSCPNCDTDLSLIRLLSELPSSSPQATGLEKSRSQQKFAGWQLGAALLILTLGIGLGSMGSFLFLGRSQLLTNTVGSPSPIVIKSARAAAAPPIAQKLVAQKPTQYTVKPGDNLARITEQLCGKGKSWQVMVKANPQLNTRPNLINVNEVLKLPNCEG